MAVNVPEVYMSSGGVPALYDWLDLIQGVGYKRFYLANGSDSTGSFQFLSPESNLDSGGAGVMDTESTDFDYDITFGTPATIMNADALINFTCRAGTTGSDIHLHIDIFHVREDIGGVTETPINTSVESSTYTGNNTDRYYRACIKTALTRTRFAIGDKLRINILGHESHAGDNSYYADPASTITYTEFGTNRTIGTDFTIDIPFKVEI
jgi:hypothetical protein